MPKHHRWMALGKARVSTSQAMNWAHGESGVIREPVQVHFDEVVCAVCLEISSDDTTPECPGREDERTPLEHPWEMSLTTPVPDEPNEDFDPHVPQSIAVTCMLCGQRPEEADEDCPERAVWLGPAADVPNDLSAMPTNERVPRYALRSDMDADLHLVAEVGEDDATQWQVLEVRPDGQRDEIPQHPFVSTGFGPYEGRPAWHVGNDFTVEIHLPGRPTPYTITGGRNPHGFGAHEIPPDPE